MVRVCIVLNLGFIIKPETRAQLNTHHRFRDQGTYVVSIQYKKKVLHFFFLLYMDIFWWKTKWTIVLNLQVKESNLNYQSVFTMLAYSIFMFIVTLHASFSSTCTRFKYANEITCLNVVQFFGVPLRQPFLKTFFV